MLPLAKPYFNKAELNQIEIVLRSGWVAGQGPKSFEFEDKIKKYLNVPYCVVVNNCTAALHLGLLALNVKKGDEVIVADFTFPATGHAVAYTGAKPVFCDVKLDTFNIDEDKIEGCITPKTKAIIVVHTFGNPCNMPKIMQLARKYTLNVIEDAACALGSMIKQKMVGTFGKIGCFSFHARKNITTGEGGCLVTHNKQIYKVVRALSCFGMESAYSRQKSKNILVPKFKTLGYNYKLSDINAAIGIIQLRKLKSLIKKRISLANFYVKFLKEIPDISFQSIENNAMHIYQSFSIIVHEKKRDTLMLYLKKHGIQTQIGTYSSSIQPVYQIKVKCKNSFQIYKRSIALPMYFELTQDEVMFICDKIKKFFKRG